MHHRFSDIFIYSTSTDMSNRTIVYKDCYLLKSVGDFNPRNHIDTIIYDIDGIYIFLIEKEISSETCGPYCLTIQAKRSD